MKLNFATPWNTKRVGVNQTTTRSLAVATIALATILLSPFTPIRAYADTSTYQGITFECLDGSADNSVRLGGQKGKEIQIVRGGSYRISGTWDAASSRWDQFTFPKGIITVATTDPVTIELSGINLTAPEIDLQGKQVFGIGLVDGASAHLVLSGSNRIDMGTIYNSQSVGAAGISLGTNASIVISGTGSLFARGGQNNPGIGAAPQTSGSSITINGGNIEAYGGKQAAGIGAGGAYSGSIKSICIQETEGQSIQISAEGGENAGAGIGSGEGTSFEAISISSGTIRASACKKNGNWTSGAGIGGGGNSLSRREIGSINIAGGKVIATSKAYGAGIGGGTNESVSSIAISGGDVLSVAPYYGAGIGGGNRASGGGSILIEGPSSVVAISRYGMGIGDTGANGPAVAISLPARVQSYSGDQLAMPTDTVVSNGSIANLQFTDILPESMLIFEQDANPLMTITVPAEASSFAKSFAFSAPTPSLPIRVKDTSTNLHAKTTDDDFEFTLRDDTALTKTELTWGDLPIKYFTVTVEVQGHGTVSPSNISVPEGSNVQLNLKADLGYQVGTAAMDGAPIEVESSITINSISNNHAVSVNFIPSTYRISYDLQGGTFEDVAPTSYTIESHDFALPAPTKRGFTFMGWSINGSDSPRKSVLIKTGSTGDIQATATWEKKSGTVNDDGSAGDQSSGKLPATGDPFSPDILLANLMFASVLLASAFSISAIHRPE